MTTRTFRSIVRLRWSLSLLIAFLIASPLGSRPPTAAAEAAGHFRVLIPLALVTKPAIAASAMELQVVALTNDLRQQHGCAPLQASSALTTAAHDHSQEMADHNYFDHVDLSGHHSDWRAQQAGYTGNAGWENIAAGYPTAEAVVAGWYNETPPNDGHRRNLLNCALTEIGVGATTNAQSDYNTYWTQDFGQRAADAPTAQDAAAMPVDEPITVEAAVMLPIDEPIRVEAAVMLPGEDKHELEK